MLVSLVKSILFPIFNIDNLRPIQQHLHLMRLKNSQTFRRYNSGNASDKCFYMFEHTSYTIQLNSNINYFLHFIDILEFVLIIYLDCSTLFYEVNCLSTIIGVFFSLCECHVQILCPIIINYTFP